MIEHKFKFTAAAIFVPGVMLFALSTGNAHAAPQYTNQGFLDAAHKNCSEVQQRAPRSCECEQKLISGDRLSNDDKEMAYYYWVDRKEYGKRFEKKKKADPKWQAGFAQRFNNLQALIMSACGK